TKDLVSIALVWVQVPSSAFFIASRSVKSLQNIDFAGFFGLQMFINYQRVSRVCPHSAPQ
ncbi:hypothetical protein LIQ05_17835, partial [Blautia glucerasea]|uniref:hypothetical protein n=1 Tax=Blautia glucerasea TaxID=536633 RepID=UPI001D02D871